MLASNNFLSRGRSTHLLLLFQKLKPGKVLVELLQSHVLFGLLLDSQLVPLLHDSILGLIVVHKGIANLTCLRMLLEQAHRMSDLAPLILREEQDFVGALDKDLLLGPETAYVSDFLQYFVVFEPQYDHFVF